MSKDEFLTQIKKELGFMPYEEIKRAESFFSGFFIGDEDEEAVVERLGDPKTAAREYYRSHVSASPVKEGKKSRGAIIWICAVAVIVLMPLILPILIAVSALIFAIVLAAVGIVFAAFFGGIAMWLGGSWVILRSIVVHAGLANMSFQIGLGCVMFAVGLFMAWLVVFIFGRIISRIVRKATGGAPRC